MSSGPRRPGRAIRSVACALALCACVLAGAEAVGAQDAPRAAERARAQARLDSLASVLRNASARATAENEAQREAAAVHVIPNSDTIAAGPLRVIVQSGDAERARPHFESAWRYYAPMLAGEAPAPLTQALFAFDRRWGAQGLDIPAQILPVLVRPWDRDPEVERAVRLVVARVLTGSLPWPQSSWIAPSVVTLHPAMEPVYRQVVTGLSPRLGECQAGSLESCWVAMGATAAEVPADDVRLWYAEEQRRALVRANMMGRPTSWAQCLEGPIELCDELLVELGDRLEPLRAGARASLVSVALEMGGEGAFHRLAEASPTPRQLGLREVIARTAGRPADQVMAEWRRRVLEARPAPPVVERGARVGTMAWVLFFVALATRSTRWRLG